MSSVLTSRAYVKRSCSCSVHVQSRSVVCVNVLVSGEMDVV